jgi:hypothetical protein
LLHGNGLRPGLFLTKYQVALVYSASASDTRSQRGAGMGPKFLHGRVAVDRRPEDICGPLCGLPWCRRTRRSVSDLRERPVSWFRDLISKGIPSAGMPAFDLSEGELDAIATLAHSLNLPAAENTVSGDRPAGQRYFFGKGQCASCHMVNGKGFSDLASL